MDSRYGWSCLISKFSSEVDIDGKATYIKEGEKEKDNYELRNDTLFREKKRCKTQELYTTDFNRNSPYTCSLLEQLKTTCMTKVSYLSRTKTLT